MVSSSESPRSVATRVGNAFEVAGVRYVLGGSLASSVWGEPRATQDADFSAALEESQVDAWVRALGPDFEVDRAWIVDAVRKRGFFCVLFRPTHLKVDVYVRPDEGFARSERDRARHVWLAGEDWNRTRIATAEDCVLSKLRWYRLGDEQSDRQWRDVLAMLRQSGAGMDTSYLQRWAIELEVADLLERAWKELRPADPRPS